MAKYQVYAEYKDSGVEWLGAIPKDWELKKHKYIAVFSKGKNPEPLLDNYSDGLYPYLSMDSLRGKADSKYAEYKKGLVLVEDNQPLIIWDGSNSGEFVLGKKGILSSTMASSSLIYKVESKFYWYVCICIEPEMRKHATGMGIPHVNGEELRGIALPLPDRDEQQKISNFLDHETTKIDHLIEKQQQLIELLKEKRQAVISHAVTKGLNPNVPMKDSGVEWLGEVPEHWDITKLKWKASTISGSTPTTSKYELYYENGSIPWIRTTDLNNGDLYETPILITPRGVNETACSILPVNSILIAMYGGAGSIGKHALLKFESTINQAVCGVLPSKYFNADYLHRFYEFYRPFWMIGASGTRKDPNIGQDHIKEALVPLPPLEEQVLISNFISEMQSTYDAITQKAESAIQLMQERRTALISAAVTGKIDVRNWQAPTLADAHTELSA